MKITSDLKKKNEERQSRLETKRLKLLGEKRIANIINNELDLGKHKAYKRSNSYIAKL
jgi:hypothetical protein